MESDRRSKDFDAKARLDFAYHLLALNDTLESLFAVDLNTGAYSFFTKPQSNFETIEPYLFENQDFFIDVQEHAHDIFYEEDREEICTVLTRSFLRTELEKHNHFDWYFRLMIDKKPAWYMLRAVYQNESRTHVTIGVINAEKDMQLRHQATIQAMLDHETFKADLLNYYAENEGDPINLLEHFTTRILDLYQCDQVVYRNQKESKVSLLSTNLESSWNVPISYCLQCEQYDANQSMCLAGIGNSEDSKRNTALPSRYSKCPIKSSLTRAVTQNGTPAGFLSVNYVVGSHDFTDYECKTLDEICKILSIALSRYTAKKAAERAAAKRKKEENAKQLANEHIRLRLDALNFIVDYECTPFQFLEFISGRLLQISGCDQVVYRDLDGNRYVKNSSELGSDFEIPEDYCKNCPHDNPLNELYKYEFTEMPNCADGFLGVSTHERCPIKSKLTRLVYLNGKTAGFISIHYIRNTHRFTDAEIRTFKEIAAIISLALSRLEARKTNAMLRKEVELKNQVEESLKIIEGLASTYSVVFLVDLVEDRAIPYAMNDSSRRMFTDELDSSTSYSDIYKRYVDTTVFVPDIEEMLKICSISNLKKQLRNKKTFSHIYRSSFTDKIEYREITFVKCEEEHKKPSGVIVGISNKHSEILEQKVSDTLLGDYTSMYIADLDNNYCQPILRSKTLDKVIGGKQRTFSKVNLIMAELVDEKYKEFWENFSDPHWAKAFLADEDRKESLYHVSRFNHWYRSEFRVLERNAEGEASKIIISGQIVDAEYAEKMAADKKLEEALEDAKSASRAKSTFLSNMSHDIRTPMNAIIGFTNLAVSHIDDTDLIKDYLTKIDQSSTHLLSLINDVLDMSRIESGKMTLSEQEENLAEIIHMVRSIIEYDIRSKNLNFRVEVSNLSDEDIIVDKLRLNQVLLNTLNNAIKYTPNGGSIALTISEKSSRKKGYATYQFKVKDNGVGMSPQFASTIFDPFTREKTSTISGIQGTGLGMSITKSIVDLMGGTIGVVSEEGHGTEVTICCTFKLVKSQPRPKKATSRKKKTVIKKILMVEDNPLNREIAQELLEESGFTVSTVNDGIYAVETMKHAKKGDYDLILMDIQMPIMDGYQATRKIRALRNGVEKIPIIAITANAFDEDRKAAMEAGMNDHVAKPINLQRLLEAIDRLS